MVVPYAAFQRYPSLAMAVTARTTATLEKVLVNWIGEPLGNFGFRRANKRWLRRCSDERLVSVIEAVCRFYPDSNDVRFTVEWAVFLKGYAEAAWGKKSGAPSTATAPFVVRIGALSAGRRDLWWEVTEDSIVRLGDAAEAGRRVSWMDDELSNLLQERLLPLASRDWSVPDLKEFLSREADTGILRLNISLEKPVLEIIDELV